MSSRIFCYTRMLQMNPPLVLYTIKCRQNFCRTVGDELISGSGAFQLKSNFKISYPIAYPIFIRFAEFRSLKINLTWRVVVGFGGWKGLL